MAFVPVPDTCQVELVYHYGTVVCENVLHYSGDLTGGETVLQALATNAILQWQDTWRGEQSTSITLFSVKVTDIRSQEGPGVEVATTSNNTGQKVETVLPFNDAICISMKTLYRGRSYRGRVFLPGITTASLTGSAIKSSTITSLNATFAYWDFLDANGEPFALQVVSRYHNGAPRTQGIHTDVVGFVTNGIPASQRRRTPGRGI